MTWMFSSLLDSSWDRGKTASNCHFSPNDCHPIEASTPHENSPGQLILVVFYLFFHCTPGRSWCLHAPAASPDLGSCDAGKTPTWSPLDHHSLTKIATFSQQGKNCGPHFADYQANCRRRIVNAKRGLPKSSHPKGTGPTPFGSLKKGGVWAALPVLACAPTGSACVGDSGFCFMGFAIYLWGVLMKVDLGGVFDERLLRSRHV